jgi:2-iminobutanoate/2-iminopropanoate deaminase
MMKRVLETKKAPAAIGPYSQGIANDGKLVFTAGQIGLDPETGKLVPGGIEAETVRSLENIKAVLEVGLTSFDRIIRTTIYLTDIKDFPVVNEIYARYFERDKYPARCTVQVAALPMGARIEIECIAAAV